MKHTIITFCVVAMFFSVTMSADAQKVHSEDKNDLAFTVGFRSFAGFLEMGVSGDFYPRLKSYPDRVPIRGVFYGRYGLHYHHHLRWWLQVGAKVGVEANKMDEFTDATRTEMNGFRKEVWMSLMPSLRFSFVNSRKVRLYAGIDIGANFRYTHENNFYRGYTHFKEVRPEIALNITPIGIEIGSKVYVMTEWNLGSNSFLNFGLGYRF